MNRWHFDCSLFLLLVFKSNSITKCCPLLRENFYFKNNNSKKNLKKLNPPNRPAEKYFSLRCLCVCVAKRKPIDFLLFFFTKPNIIYLYINDDCNINPQPFWYNIFVQNFFFYKQNILFTLLLFFFSFLFFVDVSVSIFVFLSFSPFIRSFMLPFLQKQKILIYFFVTITEWHLQILFRPFPSDMNTKHTQRKM